MKTIDIKGKSYIMVNERILYFWNEYLNGRQGQLITTLLSMEGGICVFKAEAIVEGILMATGHAYEKEGSTFINKTSYVENCETSACGRCLGLLGIGIEDSIATAEEVENAIIQQKQKVSADFEKELDSYESAPDVEAYLKKNLSEIKTMALPEQKKLRAYADQICEVFNKSEGRDKEGLPL